MGNVASYTIVSHFITLMFMLLFCFLSSWFLAKPCTVQHVLLSQIHAMLQYLYVHLLYLFFCHFHSISMSYNFSLELCFSFFRQFTKSSHWRTPLSAWSTFHGRLNPWMRTQYCLEMIKVRQTILLILSTIFENIVEDDIFLFFFWYPELELDHVNPLHPYIHMHILHADFYTFP